jgi:hypothetical protein
MSEEIKTYIIAGDGYMDGPSMRDFKGTYRALLEDLVGASEWDEADFEEEEGCEHPSKWPLSRLIEVFNEGNGDGQDYYQVWCVEDGKKVLG